MEVKQQHGSVLPFIMVAPQIAVTKDTTTPNKESKSSSSLRLSPQHVTDRHHDTRSLSSSNSSLGSNLSSFTKDDVRQARRQSMCTLTANGEVLTTHSKRRKKRSRGTKSLNDFPLKKDEERRAHSVGSGNVIVSVF